MLTIYEIVEELLALVGEIELSLTEEELERYLKLKNEYYMYWQEEG